MGIITPAVSLITGAASGFGRAIVLELIRSGGTKFILCDVNRAGLDTTVSEAQSLNLSVEIHSVLTDVSDPSAVESLVTEGVAKFGRIDHSVHCAGISGTTGSTTDATVEDFERVMAVNTKGVWVCSKYVLRQMKKQEPRKLENGTLVRGSVVNVSSIMGLVASPRLSAYVASKHAVVGLSKADAADGATYGIRVNAICPGYCATPIIPTATMDKVQTLVQASCRMGRMGYAEEIANVVTFLLSDKASYLTGAAIPVDGGLTAI